MNKERGGEHIMIVVGSHRWFWKPHVSLHSMDDTITLQWLRFHARYWRKGKRP